MIRACLVAAVALTLLAQAPQPTLFQRNRARLAEKLRALGPGTVAVVRSGPVTPPREGQPPRPYRADADAYYFSGVHQPGLVLLVDPEAPCRAFLPKEVPEAQVAEAKAFAADQVQVGDPEKDLATSLAKACQVVVLSARDPDFLKRLAEQFLGGRTLGKDPRVLVDGRPLAAELRLLKGPEEIARLRKAAEASVEGIRAAQKAKR